MLFVSIFDVSGTGCGVRIEDLHVKKSMAKGGIPDCAIFEPYVRRRRIPFSVCLKLSSISAFIEL